MIFDWRFALQILPELMRALLVTVQATLAGFAIALVLGMAWALLRRSKSVTFSRTVFWFVEFIRSTPLLVQVYFMFFALPEYGLKLSPLATGVAALGLHYSAYLSEVFRAGIEAVPRGQWEAARALNMSRYRTWTRVILPQAIPPVTPVLGNYLIAMFKDTPMLAAITVMELLQSAKLIGAQTFRYMEPLTLVGLLFLLVSLMSSFIIRRLENKFNTV
ncbi:MAG: ectoine/hydroxyectoine ABC transporter permease subunit EhuD [Nitrospinota bacterium]|nr:ectoine/hydroxyectoine ABC transporter permease subunit EhuD [Nitrospinota bacterium]